MKDKILDINWRTNIFERALILACLISIALYSMLLIGFRSLSIPHKNSEKVSIDYFHGVEIEARSAFVWDVLAGRSLFEKNANEALPLASLTKVMTAVTLAQNSLDDKKITIELEDLSPEGDSLLKVSSSWNIRSLIDYVLLVSSNDGAHALAASMGAIGNLRTVDNREITRRNFIGSMNRLSQELGLSSMTFKNEHGLDIGENESGAYGSARDVALLFEYAIKKYPHVLEATRYPLLSIRDLSNDFYNAENTNEIINSVPSPIASKTGYTKLAGGNLVMAYDAGLGHPIVISVLGSTQEGRFSDMLKLIEASQKYLIQ
ncbi:MAG TPA: hypothetical protein VJH67_01470 [Candidatus Paceibacterota bacterium]